MLAFRKSFPVMLSDMDHTVENKDNTNSNRSPPSFANSKWDDDVEDNVDSVDKDHLQDAGKSAREGSRGINFHPRILNFLNNNYFYFNFKQKIDTCMKGTIKIN